MAPALDTQAAVQDLVKAGVQAEVAQAIIQAVVRLESTLASKADLDHSVTRLDAKIDHSVALLDGKIDKALAAFTAEVAQMEMRTMRRTVGFGIALAALLFAALRLT